MSDDQTPLGPRTEAAAIAILEASAATATAAKEAAEKGVATNAAHYATSTRDLLEGLSIVDRLAAAALDRNAGGE